MSQYIISVDSTNRGPAKKILSTWYPAKDVRTWTIAELEARLTRACNEGLITREGIRRVMEAKHERQEGGNFDDGAQEKDNEKGGESDALPSESNQSGDSGNDSGGDSNSQQDDSGASEQDGQSEQQEQKSQDSGESGDDKSDDKNESGESEQESESGESESEQESEQEAQEDDAQEDDGPDYHEMLPTVRKYIEAGLNVALVGPAGTGKSTIAQMLCPMLDLEFRGCGALMSKYDLVGYKDASGQYHQTPLYEAYTDGHLFCFDELDASAPDAVVAFNAITDNQNVFAFPNGMHPKHERFVAIACMNTFGNGATADYVGRYKQDAASMSRFVKVYIGYDLKIEARLGPKDIVERVWSLRQACETLGLRHIVSTRMIVQAAAARKAKATKSEIDRDIFFAGLDDAQIKQVKSTMTANAKARS